MRRALPLAALALLPIAPLTVVAPARGADALTSIISGMVYAPDGTTPAAAAIIDVSIADRTIHAPITEPFVRAVTARDGTYTLDVTPTDLVTPVLQAFPDGTPVSVRLAVADLAPAPEESATASGLVEYLDAVVVLSSDGSPTIYVSAPDRAKALVTSTQAAVVKQLAPYAMFGDPDLAAGKEDVDDPELVPPLGAQLATVPMNDVLATYHSVVAPAPPVGGAPSCHEVQIQTTASGYVGVPGTETYGTICDKAADGGGGTGSPCTLARTEWFPADGDKQPVEGVKQSATIKVYHCTDESDSAYDYWGLSMDGWARPVDSGDHVAGTNQLWRYKFRIEAPDWADAYRYMQVDPKQDSDDGGVTVHWSVGLTASGPSGSIGGDYTPGSGGKMHPWPEDSEHQLYHVSWISHNKWGLGGGPYWSGGGATYRVPKDTDVDGFTSVVKREVLVWRCWMQHTDRENQWYCDPKS